jgi:hypothetical protein
LVQKGRPRSGTCNVYVITIKAASVERELEIFPQQGNNEEDSSNKKNRNEDERQNLLFLPLLIPIVRKFWFQTSLPRPYKKASKLFGENCLDSSAAVVRDGVPARLAWKTSGIPQVRGTPDVNFAYGCRSSHRTSLNYFWATTTAGLAMALVASSFSTRVIGNWRPLFSP